MNIFLKQFKEGNEEIVELIREGDVNKIGAERLRGLQKILPDSEEVGIRTCASRYKIHYKKMIWVQ